MSMGFIFKPLLSFSCLFLFVLVLESPTIRAEQGVSEAIRFDVEKYTLDNGLTVLLHVDHTTPIVSMHKWYRVGSRHEKPGRTGLAHFFEHLMFKGTEKYPGKSFDRIVQANGGRINAFTSKDYTGYYIDVPAGRLELALDLESDRMRNLTFDPQEIQSEREVVKEERRFRVEDSVPGSLDEAVYHTVFRVHPYRWPVIGYMRDLNAATMEDLKEFYRVYYAPNNAVLVIAGSFDKKEAKKLVEKYYAGIPAQELPKEKLPVEPPQTGQRSVVLRRDVQNPTVSVAYRSSRAGDKDSYTFDVMANILAEGSSSRLYRRLVYREQTVDAISAWAYTPFEPATFQVISSIKSGVEPERVLTSIYAELYKMRTELVTAEELQKAKNQIMKSYVDALKTVSGRARLLALNEIILGDYEQIFLDLKKYNEVTAEDIKNLAERYLMPHQRSVVQVLPRQPRGEE